MQGPDQFRECRPSLAAAGVMRVATRKGGIQSLNTRTNRPIAECCRASSSYTSATLYPSSAACRIMSPSLSAKRQLTLP